MMYAYVYTHVITLLNITGKTVHEARIVHLMMQVYDYICLDINVFIYICAVANLYLSWLG